MKKLSLSSVILYRCLLKQVTFNFHFAFCCNYCYLCWFCLTMYVSIVIFICSHTLYLYHFFICHFHFFFILLYSLLQNIKLIFNHQHVHTTSCTHSTCMHPMLRKSVHMYKYLIVYWSSCFCLKPRNLQRRRTHYLNPKRKKVKGMCFALGWPLEGRKLTLQYAW